MLVLRLRSLRNCCHQVFWIDCALQLGLCIEIAVMCTVRTQKKMALQLQLLTALARQLEELASEALKHVLCVRIQCHTRDKSLQVSYWLSIEEL